jgi:hypothetical protein
MINYSDSTSSIYDHYTEDGFHLQLSPRRGDEYLAELQSRPSLLEIHSHDAEHLDERE